MNQENQTDQLDQAVANRLAQLANRPVDVAQLEQQLNLHLPAEGGRTATTSPLSFRQRMRPLMNVAAAVLIVMTIGWVVFKPDSAPAVAAPASMAQLHFDVVNGLLPRFIVNNVSEANERLAEQSNGASPLPLEMPGQIMSCCLYEYSGTTLSCVLIEQGGSLITVALADGTRMSSPMGEEISRNGRPFSVHQADGINMVMAHEAGRWLCVMGDVPIEELIAVAAAIEM